MQTAAMTGKLSKVSKLESALALAGRGFRVFPLAQNSKLPNIDAWQLEATTNFEKISSWWTCPVLGVKQDWNIGICTTHFRHDATGTSSLLVIDVDNKGDKHGDDTLLALELEGCEFPPTLEALTPTGGRHLIYSVDKPLRQGTNVFGPGIDTRSRGGFIVGVGSSVPAGQYHWKRLHEICAAPDWMLTRIGDEVHVGSQHILNETPSESVDQHAALQRAKGYLLDNAPLAIEGSGGDHTTFTVAARLKDIGIDADTATQLLLGHWNDRCSPPWNSDELRTKVYNAYRYGRQAAGADAPEMFFQKRTVEGTTDDYAEAIASTETKHPFDTLNDSYAWIKGSSHILWETHDEHGHPVHKHLSLGDFHNDNAAFKMTTGEKSMPVTKQWMQSKDRRTYDGICFAPGQDAGNNHYNMWRGFAYEPAEGGHTAVDQWLEHARYNVCNNDETLYNWLIGFFAHMIQKPWEKPLVSLVLRGGKGVGKNAFIDPVGRLLGSHYLLSSNRRYLVGNFNGHLENCLMFALDEAFWSGDKQAEGTIKDLITGDRHVIERKGSESYTVANRTRVIIIGNEDWLVPATHDERRFAVFDVGVKRKQDISYFQQMRNSLAGGGYRHLLHALQNYDIGTATFSQAPHTAALLEQKHESLEPFEQWWLDCLREGTIIGDFNDSWPEIITTVGFRDAFKRYHRDRNIRSRIPRDDSFGRSLRRMAPRVRRTKMRQGDTIAWAYQLPSLGPARAQWDEFIGHQTQWE